MLIDAHCHVQEKPKALEEWLSHGILPLLTGHSPKSNRKAYEVGREKSIPFVVGIAPQEAQKGAWEEKVKDALALAKEAKAVGEIGLDHHWAKEEAEREEQREAFKAQLTWARGEGKPIVIHSRKAIEEVVDMLNQHYQGRALFHFFSENIKALEGLKEGITAYISIVGLPSKERKKAIKATPLERLVVETDGPYVVREPEGLKEAIAYIARVKELPIETVERATVENAKAFYSL